MRYTIRMGRWEPNARARLEQAALELYTERGYQQTTVAEIASRAGLAERTFFRHFADKREVLFGSGAFISEIAKSVDEAPASATPMGAIAVGLRTAGEFLRDRHAIAGRRMAIINANTELKEREVMKLASLATELAHALRRRGVGDPTAHLAAETGMAVFKVAFERWICGNDADNYQHILEDLLHELRDITETIGKGSQ